MNVAVGTVNLLFDAFVLILAQDIGAYVAPDMNIDTVDQCVELGVLGGDQIDSSDSAFDS